MSDISSQLIKDSYNYVLQSDLSTGIIYRIGGGIPVNPIFLSGLTINDSFNFSDGTEQPNYVLTTDGTGSAFWGPQSGSSVNYYTTSGITSSKTLTWDKTYYGISGTTNVNLILPDVTSKEGHFLIIKDEKGNCGTYRIRITPSSGLIDGNNYVDMNINFMSLTCMVRDGNWYLI